MSVIQCLLWGNQKPDQKTQRPPWAVLLLFSFWGRRLGAESRVSYHRHTMFSKKSQAHNNAFHEIIGTYQCFPRNHRHITMFSRKSQAHNNVFQEMTGT